MKDKREMTSNDINLNFVFRTPRGKSTVAIVPVSAPYDVFLRALLERAAQTDQQDQEQSSNVNVQLSRLTLGVHRKVHQHPIRLVRRRTGLDCFVETRSSLDPSNSVWMNAHGSGIGSHDSILTVQQEANYDDYYSDCFMDEERSINFSQLAYVVLNGKVLGRNEYNNLIRQYYESTSTDTTHHISLRVRVRGGIDRQNRVGSKFGGGGVSSEQQSERERKERLRQLALETVDLAKDPYLMRNHLGTYECKLCLTLHTNEG
jgi:hypothetical protein